MPWYYENIRIYKEIEFPNLSNLIRNLNLKVQLALDNTENSN